MANSRLKNISVLIVDDQALIRKLVHNILTVFGFDLITIAKSGREAIDLLNQQSFDLIITDWRMGDLDGIDILRYVRNSPNSLSPNTPIIFLTGNAEFSDVSTARDAGVNEYLIKPFSASELISRIRSVIERPRSFVHAPGYRGPDRRRRMVPLPG
jgi:DNA-binding response OmpR family regulator